MNQLRALILSDGRPGHYHLAEGVVAAIGRLSDIAIEHRTINRRRWVPGRALAALVSSGANPARILRLGYGIVARDLPPSDLVISAGGDTLAANVAAARHLGARNIFCGTLRRIAPDNFDLIVTSYARFANVPRHIVALKPNGMDPDELGRPDVVPRFGPDRVPSIVGLLIGGNSGLFHYDDAEWQTLLDFLQAMHDTHGTRWIVSTSRRTSTALGNALDDLTNTSPAIREFIDFRTAGPGTLPHLFSNVEAVLCGDDSSTMISEAVCARLPVIGFSPHRHDFKPEEAEYRSYMDDSNWYRSIPLAELTPSRFLQGLSDVRPMPDNHLDNLAAKVRERLPELFADLRARDTQSPSA